MTFRAITGTLKLRTPLHVGTDNSTETIDDLVRRDARGRPLIPGTALAGALRAIATNLAPRLKGVDFCHAVLPEDTKKACGCLVCQIFGDVNPQEDATEGNSARILVYDAILDNIPDIQIRDAVGSDRVTGAAARRERIKFDVEILPATTTFKLRLELDPTLTDELALQLLAATLMEWRAGRGTVGGRSSRGLGAFDLLDDLQLIERDLNKVEPLLAFLRNGPPWGAKDGNRSWAESNTQIAQSSIVEWTGEATLPVARSWALAKFTLEATGPFLIHDLVQAARGGFHHAPLLDSYNQGGKPVLPGSSLRGVLRSQAERIARTLATQSAWRAGEEAFDRKNYFLSNCPACNPLTTESSNEVASCNSFIKTLPKQSRRELEQNGAEEKLCLACRLFGSTWNGSRLRVEDSYLKDGTEAKYKVLDFLAIDRFTGGGRDSAKFDALVLWKPQFSVRLFLDNPEPWELGWLALALRDVHEGLATVGFGSAKGFGECCITDQELTIGILHDKDFPLPILPINSNNATMRTAITAGKSLGLTKGENSGLYKTIVFDSIKSDDWLTLANGWVQSFNDMVVSQPRFNKFVLKADSYFTDKAGYWLPDLYPMRIS